jgi:hypothetical protein
MGAPREPVHPGDSRFRHSYAMWSPFKFDERSRGEPSAWRVEEFLGHDHCPSARPVEPADWRRVVDDVPDADLVVLDDAGLGFRDHDDLWPQAIAKRRHPWILVKMAVPVADGPLWTLLHREHSDRLVVVMTVNDLRRTEVQISRELSWERTAQDLFWELVHNPRVNALSDCAHVVISFGLAGAVLLSRVPKSTGGKAEQRASWKCLLFFDPQSIEGTWEQEHPGGMIGYNTCLTAAIARQLMLSVDQPDIHRGIQSGLAAARQLHLAGYGERGGPAEQARLVFPIQRIAGQLAGDRAPFAAVEVQDPMRFLAHPEGEGKKAGEPGFWTILEDRYRDNLSEVAERIVLEGADAAMQGVPLGQFRDLLTVDRREIESFRSIRALVGEYCRAGHPVCPISIAVFGAPGSGKSFGITQVAKSLLPGQIDVLNFNLSQLGSAADLLAALHQVRDSGLSGQIPLVFWDEFDTPLAGEPLGWLRYFLSPMQDGKFQEGQITHPIGGAIFVFAGGTSERMADFGQGLTADQFRTAKGPDFVSRLKGYVNILGPNRRKAGADPYYVIRRAILLRSILQRNRQQLFSLPDGKGLLNIDPGVLRAFLQTREYKHGIRSMESIVAMSLLTGKVTYERSSLPSEPQLDLHVDGQDFMALVQQMDLTGEILEKLAEAAHKVYCQGLRKSGYRYGPVTDDGRKISSALVDYAKLPEDLKEQNRDNVRDIPNKLALIGYVMIQARSNEPPFGFPGPDLGRLAEMEHNRWMKAKIAAGWRHGLERDAAEKLNPALLLWRPYPEAELARIFAPSELAAIGPGELPEAEKVKDYDLVRAIPDILKEAGFAIVKLRVEGTQPSPGNVQQSKPPSDQA